jgi:tetratricopeptide (TPR) repeat protein
MNNNFKNLYLFGVGIALFIGLHLLGISNAIVVLVLFLAFLLYLTQTGYFNNQEARSYFYRGNARYQQGDNQGAIENYNQALQLDPNMADAYLSRAVCRCNLGELRAAIEDFNQAIHLAPNKANAYISRGNARYDLGELREAIADFNQAIHLAPNDAFTYIHRGNTRCKLGELREAIADFNQAIHLADVTPPTCGNLPDLLASAL